MEAIEDKRLKAIQECYNGLGYYSINYYTMNLEVADIKGCTHIDYKILEMVQTNISILGEEMNFADINDFSDRFLKTASVIEENLSFFKAACKHSDIITTIIEYLNYFGMKFMLDSKYDEEYEKDEIVLLVLFTILKICGKFEILCPFITNAIIGKSALEKSIQYQHLKQTYNDDSHAVIILADSDLYAFIICYKYVCMSITHIWIQEPIKKKFLRLMNNIKVGSNIQDMWDICTFQRKEELFTACWTEWTELVDEMNIISIWTEDIAFAKNLAMSLYGDVIFINTYMDFYHGIVLLPFTRIFNKTVLFKLCEPDFDDSIEEMSVVKSSVYNFFYDGMWQLPVNGTYWIHDDEQWANATSDDINKCINSAEKGCEIWSSKAVAHRTQILSKFVSVLEGSGKPVLADVVSEEIDFSCVYVNSLFYVSQSEGLDVVKIRIPRGVIILKGENEAVLFRRLMQILIVGNSVIVICDANSCSLVPYCNMFSVSKIPLGVINLLSRKDVKELELCLCGMDYESYAKQFFSDDDLEKTYINLTKSKHIIVPFK